LIQIIRGDVHRATQSIARRHAWHAGASTGERIVRKTCILAAALLVPLALPVAAAEAVDEGRAVFDGRCKMCHKIERIAQIAKRTPEADRAAKWAKFLPSHAAGVDAAGREAVIAYMLSATAPQP
jgi:cytochrome c5